MGNRKTRGKITATTSQTEVQRQEEIEGQGSRPIVSSPDIMDVDAQVDEEPLEVKVARCFQNPKILQRILQYSVHNARSSRLPSRSLLGLRSVCRCFWIGTDLTLRDEGHAVMGIALYEGNTGTNWVNEWSKKTVSEQSQALLRLIRRRRLLIGDIPLPFCIRVEAQSPLCCDITDLLIQLCPRDVVKIIVQEPSEDILERIALRSSTAAPCVKEIILCQPSNGGGVFLARYDKWLEGLINRCVRLKKIRLDKPPEVMRISKLAYPPTLEHLETTYCPPDTLGRDQGPLPNLQFLRLHATTALAPQPDILPILESCAGSLQRFEFISASTDPEKSCKWSIHELPPMTALKSFLMEANRIEWVSRSIEKDVRRIFPVLDSITIISRCGGSEAFADMFGERLSTMMSVRKISLCLPMITRTGNFPFTCIKRMKHSFVNLQALSLTICTRFATILRTIFSKLTGLRVLSLQLLEDSRDGGNAASSVEYEALIVGTNNKYMTELRTRPDIREDFLITAQGFPQTGSSIMLASIRQMTNLRRICLLGYVSAQVNNGTRLETPTAINVLRTLSFELGFNLAPRLTEIELSGSFAVSNALQERWRSRGPDYSIRTSKFSKNATT